MQRWNDNGSADTGSTAGDTTEVDPDTGSTSAGGAATLPFTGGDVGTLAGIGSLIAGAGTVAARAARRPRRR